MGVMFFVNSLLLGVGLAMDAFSVSVANGLKEPVMPVRRECCIAGVYALFQFAMPLIGWVCVHTIVTLFAAVQVFVPWIALALLLYIGIKMIAESRGSNAAADDTEQTVLGLGALMVQGIATSIDALSVGFTTAEYNAVSAFTASLIIALVTFCICFAGLRIGRTAGKRLSNKAGILGGVILIGIGIEIVLTFLLQ